MSDICIARGSCRSAKSHAATGGTLTGRGLILDLEVLRPISEPFPSALDLVLQVAPAVALAAQPTVQPWLLRRQPPDLALQVIPAAAPAVALAAQPTVQPWLLRRQPWS
jgi:hypothetical protein